MKSKLLAASGVIAVAATALTGCSAGSSEEALHQPDPSTRGDPSERLGLVPGVRGGRRPLQRDARGHPDLLVQRRPGQRRVHEVHHRDRGRQRRARRHHARVRGAAQLHHPRGPGRHLGVRHERRQGQLRPRRVGGRHEGDPSTPSRSTVAPWACSTARTSSRRSASPSRPTWEEYAEAAQTLKDSGTRGHRRLPDQRPRLPPGTVRPGRLGAVRLWRRAHRDDQPQRRGDQEGPHLLGRPGREGLVGTEDAFTTDYNTKLVDGSYATYVAAAWGPGYLSGLSGADDTAVWRAAPIPQWDGESPCRSTGVARVRGDLARRGPRGGGDRRHGGLRHRGGMEDRHRAGRPLPAVDPDRRVGLLQGS